LSGYAGDVWYPQPAPKDHPWKSMPSQAMTIHYSGMTLEAQKRIEDGVKDILTREFEGRDMRPQDVIVGRDGGLSRVIVLKIKYCKLSLKLSYVLNFRDFFVRYI